MPRLGIFLITETVQYVFKYKIQQQQPIICTTDLKLVYYYTWNKSNLTGLVT